jgi:hypothetical protein
MNLIKGKNCLKIINEGGEKTDSSDKEFVINKKKAVQKTDSSNIYFEENKPATSKDDVEKHKSAHGNGNEHIEKVMKQKGIKLHSLIFEDLSGEELNKINEIETNIEATPSKIYRQCGNEKVSWGSMQTLLNCDTKDQSKRWITNKVINFYFKKNLAKTDQKQCQAEPEQNRSVFFGSYFWQFITCEEYNDTTVQGKYNHKRVSKWLKYLPGGDIFNLRKIFIPINEKNRHWTCIVIFMKEKRI